MWNRLQVNGSSFTVLLWLIFVTFFGRCRAQDNVDSAAILILIVTIVGGGILTCLCILVLAAIIYLRKKTKIITETSKSLNNITSRHNGNGGRRFNHPQGQAIREINHQKVQSSHVSPSIAVVSLQQPVDGANGSGASQTALSPA